MLSYIILYYMILYDLILHYLTLSYNILSYLQDSAIRIYFANCQRREIQIISMKEVTCTIPTRLMTLRCFMESIDTYSILQLLPVSTYTLFLSVYFFIFSIRGRSMNSKSAEYPRFHLFNPNPPDFLFLACSLTKKNCGSSSIDAS